ncbi:RNA recognition motif domain-containing protein [Ditylenchus destructor]|nr:RNA recognition motif domain-containing protein [Ditylenchus destructor]
MFSLRIALQKCVRRASILGNSKICHHTSRSSIHISRLAYSNDNSEDGESASILALKEHHAQKPEITNNKSSQDIANDPEANRLSSVTDTKSSSGIESDPEAKEIPSHSENSNSPDMVNISDAEATQSIADNKGLNPAQNSKNLESNGNSEEENTSKDLTEDEMSAISNKDPLPGTVIDPEAEAIPSFYDPKSPDMVTDSEAKKTTSITDTNSLPDIANDPEPEVNSSFSDTKSLFGTSIDPEANEILSISESKALNTQISKKLEFRKYHTQAQTVAITDQKPFPDRHTTQISNNLEFRRYHITVEGVNGTKVKITEDQLKDYFSSKYGKAKVIRCSQRDKVPSRNPQAIVVLDSKKAMNRAVNSSPHHINGRKVLAKIGTNERELTLLVRNLSDRTNNKSLEEFYSRFGKLTHCKVHKIPDNLTGKSERIGFVSFASYEELDRALDAQPHLIAGSEVFLKYKTGDLDLLLRELPKGITEESLRTFFSRYGKLRQCELFEEEDTIYTHAHLTFSNPQALDRALDAKPHHFEGSTLSLQESENNLDLLIGKLPKGTTQESLHTYFSQYDDQLSQCQVFTIKVIGKGHASLLFSTTEEINCVVDDHYCDQYSDFHRKFLDVSLPENATLESLFKTVHLEVRNDGDMNQRGPYAFVSYGTWQEVYPIMDYHPHIIDRKPLKTDFPRSQDLFTLFVGSLPENATGVSLFKAFSKFGKIVYLETRNDGAMNQRGPYGFVSYGTKQEVDKALENGPHKVVGVTVNVRREEEFVAKL